MPEFFAQHVPSNLDDFTRGYLECMEWLLPDGTNRDTLRGFTRKAIAKAKADCQDFVESNSEQLASYYELSGRSEDCAGMDFYLSRNGHGAGFFDRGNEPVFDELQSAAKVYSGTNEDVFRGWIYSY